MNTLKAVELLCKEINKIYPDYVEYVFSMDETVIELEHEDLNITLSFKDNGDGGFRELKFAYFGKLLNKWRKIGGIIEVDEILLTKVFKEIYLAHYKEMKRQYDEEHWEEKEDFYKDQKDNLKIDKILEK